MKFPPMCKLFVAIVVIGSTGNISLIIWRGLSRMRHSGVASGERDDDTSDTYSYLHHYSYRYKDEDAVNSTSLTSYSYVYAENVSGNSTNLTGLECPVHPPNLVERVPINPENLTWSLLNEHFANSTIQLGGRWRPPDCKSCHHVAILIPYRNRESMLMNFLKYIHPFLQKQLLNYGVYVIEQSRANKFNRGMLLNVGFVEALRISNYSCFVMSDVDMLPENEHNSYGCPSVPLHLSAIRKVGNRYRRYYPRYFGGVISFRTEHFRLVNGFSNMYFGWGGEDDDLFRRIRHHNFTMKRPPRNIGRYTMLSHRQSRGAGRRKYFLRSAWERFEVDGLSNLRYHFQSLEEYPLYTRITVSLKEIPWKVATTTIPQDMVTLDKDTMPSPLTNVST